RCGHRRPKRPPLHTRARRGVGAPGARGGVARLHDADLRAVRHHRHDLRGDGGDVRGAREVDRSRRASARRRGDAIASGKASPQKNRREHEGVFRGDAVTRLACFYVPMFPLAARLRSEPSLREEAVAVVEGNGGNAHVVAATRRARKKGIAPGQTLAQARSIMPKLIARGRDAECERTAQEALIEVAETFSPRLEDAGNGVVFIDIEGMERHYASEEELAKAAIRAADAMALPARVGIAASKLAARVAAELPKSPIVVAAGEEADFLAPLPLARLSPEIEAATMLQRFGLKSIGDLARLPESDIASRLGEIGRELHWAARGIDPRPLAPRALPPEFREGMELEWPLVALEPFLFIANAALDRLAKRMEMQGFACKRIEMTLTLEP